MTDDTDKVGPGPPRARRTFLLSYEVRPNEVLAERDGIGGAFVNCWVLGSSIEEVKEQANRHLESTGWTQVAVLGEDVVSRASIPDDAKEYYDQAQIDDEVYVIHVFPPEPADA
jgi:hypothetical protein